MSDEGLEHLKSLKKAADERAAKAKIEADRNAETQKQMKSEANAAWIVLGKTLESIATRYNDASASTNVTAEFKPVARNPGAMPDYSFILRTLRCSASFS